MPSRVREVSEVVRAVLEAVESVVLGGGDCGSMSEERMQEMLGFERIFTISSGPGTLIDTATASNS